MERYSERIEMPNGRSINGCKRGGGRGAIRVPHYGNELPRLPRLMRSGQPEYGSGRCVLLVTAFLRTDSMRKLEGTFTCVHHLSLDSNPVWNSMLQTKRSTDKCNCNLNSKVLSFFVVPSGTSFILVEMPTPLPQCHTTLPPSLTPLYSVRYFY